MDLKLSFLGAAQNVTGSRYVVESNGVKLMVDCGLYQERKFQARNWDPFSVPPASLQAVLLTHAHLDHCGLLPKLVRDGFKGRVYCTPATSEIAQIIILDSASIQEEDAAFKKRRHQREGRRGPFPEAPLYTVEDAKACLPLFSTVEYGETIQIGSGIEVTFYDAGHVLGSSMIRVAMGNGEEKRTIVFSGDVGRWDRPMLHDPNVFSKTDYVVVESTYGDRAHEDNADIGDELAEIVNSTYRVGVNIVIPSFALQRTQEVLYYLNKLLLEDRIPHLLVFLDSPMAVSITEVYKRHSELFDREMTRLLHHNKSPFDFPGLKMVQTVDESKSLNHIVGTIAVIAGSGMCTGGRVKHHLVNNISRPESTVLFVGYQAAGTLGQHILNGAKSARILGQQYPVRAKIARISGFSAHADKDDLLRWLDGLKVAPKRVFVTHGEAEAAQQFGKSLQERIGGKVSAPEYNTRAILE
jgi:metallo-beta-lactamase family protein